MIERLKSPALFLLILASMLVVWKVFRLPSEEEVLSATKEYFDRYGIMIVFISAIVEGIIMVGWYFPGSSVIFLGVIFAGGDIAKIIAVISAVTAGLFISYVINFLLGKYGWYKLLVRFGVSEPLQKAGQRVEKYGLNAAFGTFWHPNLAALTSTAAGILQVSIKKFLLYALLATIVWNIFWGTLVSYLGEKAMTLVGVRFVLAFVGLWVIFNLIIKKTDEVSSG